MELVPEFVTINLPKIASACFLQVLAVFIEN